MARVEQPLLDALVQWVQSHGDGGVILTKLTIARRCPLCHGGLFCPQGCPMAIYELDYSLPAYKREQPIRAYEQRPRDGMLPEQVLVHGRECSACNIYGYCISCAHEGLERRRAAKHSGAYWIDSVPIYSRPSLGMIDPIRIPAERVKVAREDGQLTLAGGEGLDG